MFLDHLAVEVARPTGSNLLYGETKTRQPASIVVCLDVSGEHSNASQRIEMRKRLLQQGCFPRAGRTDQVQAEDTIVAESFSERLGDAMVLIQHLGFKRQAFLHFQPPDIPNPVHPLRLAWFHCWHRRGKSSCNLQLQIRNGNCCKYGRQGSLLYPASGLTIPCHSQRRQNKMSVRQDRWPPSSRFLCLRASVQYRDATRSPCGLRRESIRQWIVRACSLTCCSLNRYAAVDRRPAYPPLAWFPAPFAWLRVQCEFPSPLQYPLLPSLL